MSRHSAVFGLLLPADERGHARSRGNSESTATANGANDTLVSNSGVDTLVGGSGHDVFIVNNASDVLQNVTADDTIESSVGYTLPSGATTLVLTAQRG